MIHAHLDCWAVVILVRVPPPCVWTYPVHLLLFPSHPFPHAGEAHTAQNVIGTCVLRVLALFAPCTRSKSVACGLFPTLVARATVGEAGRMPGCSAQSADGRLRQGGLSCRRSCGTYWAQPAGRFAPWAAWG